MKIALERLDKVLAVIMGKVDIITVGNEPFLECGKQFSDINEFYETVAQRGGDRWPACGLELVAVCGWAQVAGSAASPVPAHAQRRYETAGQ
ncbi:hypothetical protein ACWDKQ_24250 [Saccharopolyspora sp. NPDC000995]